MSQCLISVIFGVLQAGDQSETASAKRTRKRRVNIFCCWGFVVVSSVKWTLMLLLTLALFADSAWTTWEGKVAVERKCRFGKCTIHTSFHVIIFFFFHNLQTIDIEDIALFSYLLEIYHLMFAFVFWNFEQQLKSLTFTVDKHRGRNQRLKSKMRMKVTFLFFYLFLDLLPTFLVIILIQSLKLVLTRIEWLHDALESKLMTWSLVTGFGVETEL